ncbi:MAG: hypothetical protein OK439_06885, partial [Thaumarchaeota archaeon]|nr:hypothetical protein [Nitrososphaerota archaeon]
MAIEGSVQSLGTKGNWTSGTWAKIIGVTVLLTALLSVNYTGLTLSSVENPLLLILVAFLDTLVFAYFVVSSKWSGWKEWTTVFLIFYGINYFLTAIESVYLTTLLTANVVFSLLVNGAIVSGVF